MQQTSVEELALRKTRKVSNRFFPHAHGGRVGMPFELLANFVTSSWQLNQEITHLLKQSEKLPLTQKQQFCQLSILGVQFFFFFGCQWSQQAINNSANRRSTTHTCWSNAFLCVAHRVTATSRTKKGALPEFSMRLS